MEFEPTEKNNCRGGGKSWSLSVSFSEGERYGWGWVSLVKTGYVAYHSSFDWRQESDRTLVLNNS